MSAFSDGPAIEVDSLERKYQDPWGQSSRLSTIQRPNAVYERRKASQMEVNRAD